MSERDSRHVAATLTGLGAVLSWSMLATLTVASGRVPPFELTALTFVVGGTLGVLIAFARGRGRRLLPSLPMLILGVTGLFGDYVLYFGALRLAPAAQAALIVALWPLVMVILAAAFLGERLRPRHVVGVGLGLAGLMVLATGTATSAKVTLASLTGYAMAFGAAIVWAGYSVLLRRNADAPTEAVATSCLVAAVAAAACHLTLEETVAPDGPREFLAIVLIGLGPAGGAFFLWDHGVKRGSIRILAVLSYAVPVLSLVMLVASGYAAPSYTLWIACALTVLAGLCATDALHWPRILSQRHSAHPLTFHKLSGPTVNPFRRRAVTSKGEVSTWHASD